MIPTDVRWKTGAVVLLLSLGGVLTGCGADAGATPAVPASGTVLVNGKPLEQGAIQFVPHEGRPASGTVQDGRFTLSTYKDGDGAVPGKHKVAIVATKQAPPKKPGAEPETVFVVPQTYATPSTSTLMVEIPTDGKTDLEISIQ